MIRLLSALMFVIATTACGQKGPLRAPEPLPVTTEVPDCDDTERDAADGRPPCR
ncbi:MAG: lipoprotein [Xanthomonadaceae bacterium]|nr:lipoprotein [Xanthomonadaceae bacterium]